jgi:hypothetical protein
MKINTSFYIPPWKNDLSDWEEKTKTLQNQILKVYSHIPSFEKYYRTIREGLSEIDLIEVLKNDNNALLPFSFLAKNDASIFEKYHSSQISDLLEAKLQAVPKALEYYVSAVISNIDSKQETIKSEHKIIQKWFSESNAKIPSEIREILLSNGILKKAGEWCLLNEETALGFANLTGFRPSPQSKFVLSLSRTIYLIRLNKCDYSSSSALITELANRNAFSWREEGIELFGHKIIRLIIKGFEHSNVHSDWIQLILNQAGDPRVSKSSKTYLKWWSLIDDALIIKFIKALSHEDILLFLDSLAEFAEHANQDMKRMFKSRKRMLTGLSTQNIFSESRLFLPKSIYRYMQREKPNINLEHVGLLTGVNDKAVIYLRADNIHIVEGSHNCRLRIFDGLPEGVDLMNSEVKSWEYSELTSELEELYREDLLKQPFTKNHDINGNWKREAIKFLKKRFSFDESKCLKDRELNTFRYE